MNNLDITKLYNWKDKQNFIDEFTDNEGTKRTLYFDFKRIADIEKEYNKDIYDMNYDELDDVFIRCRFSTKNSAIAFISKMLMYIKWASSKALTASNLPPVVESFSDMAEKYVSKTSSIYFTQEELNEFYEEIINYQDILIIQCVFEGISGQSYSEILNLKREDVFEKENKYYVNLYDTERGLERLNFEISEFLYDLIMKVNEIEFLTDLKGHQMELMQSQYVLKKTKKGNKKQIHGEKLDANYISYRATQLKQVFGTKKFRLKDITKSGIMHYLNILMKDKENKIATSEEYIKIANRFNVGKYIHSFYKDEKVNYSAVKKMIDLDFYKENYGNIELS